MLFNLFAKNMAFFSSLFSPRECICRTGPISDFFTKLISRAE